MATLNETLINAAIAGVTNGSIKKQDKRQENTAAPNRPDEGNCGGPCREISYVQDKFVFGATGLTDGVTVE